MWRRRRAPGWRRLGRALVAIRKCQNCGQVRNTQHVLFKANMSFFFSRWYRELDGASHHHRRRHAGNPAFTYGGLMRLEQISFARTKAASTIVAARKPPLMPSLARDRYRALKLIATNTSAPSRCAPWPGPISRNGWLRTAWRSTGPSIPKVPTRRANHLTPPVNRLSSPI
jgi:hypothetical protein